MQDRAHGTRIYFYFAMAIVIMGIILRLIGLDKGIWLDESLSIETVNGAYSLHDLRTPPLYFLLLGLWSNLGTTETLLRLLSVACGIGTFIAIMLWLRPYSPAASLVAGLIAIAMPIMLRYSQEIRAYPLLLFVTALAFLFAWRLAAQTESWLPYIGLALSLSAATATHLVGMMVLPAIVIYLLATVTDLRQIHWKRLIVALAVPVALFAYIYFVFLWRIPDRVEWWMPAFSLELAASVARIVFSVPSVFRPVTLVANGSPALGIALDYATKAALVVYALCLLLFGNWRRSWPLLAAALVFWLQVLAYSVWIIPIFWYRTVLPGLVPFIGFLGLQTASIRLPKIRWAALSALALVLACFATGWILVEARTPVEPWKQTARLLEADRQPEDLVVVYPDYIAGLIHFHAPDLPTDNLLTLELGTPVAEAQAAIDQQLRSLAGNGSTPALFFIVRSDVSVKQDARALEGLLDSLATRFGPPAMTEKLGIVSISKYH